MANAPAAVQVGNREVFITPDGGNIERVSKVRDVAALALKKGVNACGCVQCGGLS